MHEIGIRIARFQEEWRVGDQDARIPVGEIRAELDNGRSIRGRGSTRDAEGPIVPLAESQNEWRADIGGGWKIRGETERVFNEVGDLVAVAIKGCYGGGVSGLLEKMGSWASRTVTPSGR